MFKRLNKLQIISIIGMIVVYILFLLNVYNMSNLFLFFLGLNLGGTIMFSEKWSKEGLTTYKKLDEKWSKNYTRKSSEKLFYAIIFCGLVYCICILLEMFIPDISNIVFGIMILIAIVINIYVIYIVDLTAKEVKEIESKK